MMPSFKKKKETLLIKVILILTFILLYNITNVLNLEIPRLNQVITPLIIGSLLVFFLVPNWRKHDELMK